MTSREIFEKDTLPSMREAVLVRGLYLTYTPGDRSLFVTIVNPFGDKFLYYPKTKRVLTFPDAKNGRSTALSGTYGTIEEALIAVGW